MEFSTIQRYRWGGLLVAAFSLSRAGAQPTQPPPPTADIGSYAPGWTDFSRYSTPGSCAAAATHVTTVARRTLAAQIGNHMPPSSQGDADSLAPPRATAIARTCGRRFRAATTAVADLADLFELALLMQDDSMAAAVVERLLAAQPNDRVRLGVLETAFGKYMTAEPARTAAAEQLLARIVSMGRSAQVPLVVARAAQLRYLVGRANFPEAARVADSLLAAIHALPPSALAESPNPPMSGLAVANMWQAVAAAHRVRLIHAWLTAPDTASGTAALLTMAPTIRADIQATIERSPEVVKNLSVTKANLRRLQHFTEPRAFLTEMLPELYPPDSAFHVPPLAAETWAPESRLPVPAAGVLSLVRGRSTDECSQDALMECGSWYSWDVWDEAVMAWLQERYGSALRATIVVRPRGDRIGEDGRMMTPAEQAAQAQRYHLEVQKWPGQLAFKPMRQDSADYTVLPAPDGRRIPKHPTFFPGPEFAQTQMVEYLMDPKTREFATSGMVTMLLDPQGRLLTISLLGGAAMPVLTMLEQNWGLVDLIIGRVLGRAASEHVPRQAIGRLAVPPASQTQPAPAVQPAQERK